MRKLTALLLALTALVVAGCGSGGSGDASKPVPEGSASSSPNAVNGTSVAQ